ncbi:MAG: DUF4145 domain-containing protein, partial [Candidatus Heimdallarchaeota archaeon]
IFKDARQYHTKVLVQINNCYKVKAYDACAVMIRRLIETLIVDIYDFKGEMEKIVDDEGNIKSLKKLVNIITNNQKINLEKNSKKLLKKGKFFGDAGAHERTAFVTKQTIDSKSSSPISNISHMDTSRGRQEDNL